MLSADRLKAFASIDHSRDVSATWDNLDGELLTVKHSIQSVQEEDPQEKTIRPNWKIPAKPDKKADPKPQPAKSSHRKRPSSHQKTKSQSKNQLGSKFELPARPDLAYREQSVEDYSDVFEGDDSIFNQGLGLTKKVRISHIKSTTRLELPQILTRRLTARYSTTIPSLGSHQLIAIYAVTRRR